MQVLNYTVVLQPDPSGGFVVFCPSFQGCYSQGNTMDAALSNIKEAIELCIEELEEEGQNLPDPAHVKIQTVAIEHDT